MSQDPPDVRLVAHPKAIVEELDRYIVGQRAAKRAVAVALRNRWRRQQVPPPMRDEIAPKNIMLIGPTGVGKTEIARRLAKLAGAPSSRWRPRSSPRSATWGRDVDSMVRDLAETAVSMLRDEERERVRARARQRRGAPAGRAGSAAAPQPRAPAMSNTLGLPPPQAPPAPDTATRETMRKLLRDGEAGRQDGGDRHGRVQPVGDRRLLRHRHGGDGSQPARTCSPTTSAPSGGGSACPRRWKRSPRRRRPSSSTWSG